MSDPRTSVFSVAPGTKVLVSDLQPAQGCAPNSVLTETRLHAQALASRAGLDVETIWTVHGGMDGQDIRFMAGVPAGTKLVTAKSIAIARHYSPAVDAIRSSGSLKAGPRPYIHSLSHVRDEYQELTGIFFTIPEHDPADLWMGLDESSPYIDFVLPAGIGVLEVEEGVYLIPGPPRVATWIRQAYAQWKKTGKAPVGLEERFLRYDETGGIPMPLEIPIEIEKIRAAQPCHSTQLDVVV